METVRIPGSRIVGTLTSTQRISLIRQRQKDTFTTLDQIIRERLQALNEATSLGCEFTRSGFLEESELVTLQNCCIGWWKLKLPNCTAVVQVRLETNRKGTPVCLVFSSEIYQLERQLNLPELSDEFLDDFFEELITLIQNSA